MQPVVAAGLGRAFAIVALLLWGAFAVGCAGPQKVLGPEGATCTKDAECTSGLTCKASRCTPERSRAGQICVTDKGCVEGLSCLSGRCSIGLASTEQVASACQHLRGLMEAATRFNQAQSGEKTSEAMLTLEMEAFAAECRERLAGSSTTAEKAICIAGAKTLDEVQACP